jgi:hypothetical protein
MTIKDLERLKAEGKIRGYVDPKGGVEKKKSKYGNVKTEIDGHLFDSQKEAARYVQLRYREKAGEITDLELQREFELIVNGEKVASYVSDFSYQESGELVVEDVKSAITRKLPTYRLKRKLMKSIYGITIKEV